MLGLLAAAVLAPVELSAIVATAAKENWRALPMGELVAKVGQQFLETPYVGSTLDIEDHNEACVVRLDGLDCVTFFETSLGIARMLKKGGTTMADLTREVTTTRYRGGKLDGYLSRLHYTGEWMLDNAKRGNVKDLTSVLPGSLPLGKTINFMSTHPDKYRQLKANPGWVPDLRVYESRFEKLLRYVPKERMLEAERGLQTGDIIGIVTNVDGLDCSHTGMVVVDEELGVRFMHASSTQKKVILDGKLSDYLDKSKSSIGIMAVRPISK
ncbi:MAG TPA: DUF1460 domain-containing protein [Fimbriimonadaceae bacterium]|nr:DUF1460 domain-containing protein [Fimbriimonadaceae bacterium]